MSVVRAPANSIGFIMADARLRVTVKFEIEKALAIINMRAIVSEASDNVNRLEN